MPFTSQKFSVANVSLKNVSLKNIFGSFNNATGALFTEVVTTLTAIINSEEIHATGKIRVYGYIKGLLKIETALTA